MKTGNASALARSTSLAYRNVMLALLRSFVVLSFAILVAATFALSAAPPMAEASVAMAPMAADEQACAKCDPTMDMAASCDLMCAMSTAAVLVLPVNVSVVLADCHFEIGNVVASGRAPSPAFTPPRMIILI